MTAAALAFGAGKRVFLLGRGMKKDGKVATDAAKSQCPHRLRRGADNHVVVVGDGATEQLVAHRASDAIDLHPGRAV